MERVENILQTSDVITVPSCWPEPSSKVSSRGWEARSVFATRSGGMEIVIVKGEDWFLVDIGDVNIQGNDFLFLAR
jgi:hypothetical protein